MTSFGSLIMSIKRYWDSQTFLLALLVSVPFCIPIHTDPVPSFWTELSASLIALTLLFMFFYRHMRVISISTTSFWVFLFCILLLWQLRTASDWRNIVPALCYLLICILLVSWAQHYKTIMYEAIAYGIIFGGIINAIFIYFQVSLGANTVGALYQSNHTGDYIFLSMISILYFNVTGRMLITRFLGLFLMFLPALVLTKSRSIILYTFVVFLISIRADRNMIIAGIITITIIVALMIKPEDSIRITLLSEAINAWKTSPIDGIGFGSFAYFFNNNKEWANHAHNIFFQLLAETGIIGIILFIIGIASWVFPFLKEPCNYEKWYVSCILSVIIIHSFLEFPLWYGNFLFLFFIFIGLGTAQSSKAFTVFILGWKRCTILFILGLAILYVIALGYMYHNMYTKMELKEEDIKIEIR